MKKQSYKDALSKLKTSEDFQEQTLKRLGLEDDTYQAHAQKGEMDMKQSNPASNNKNSKLKVWTVGIAACAVLAVGVLALNQNNSGTDPGLGAGNIVADNGANNVDHNSGTNNGVVDSNSGTSNGVVGNKPAPPTTAKHMVNIDGIIEEVSEDGKSFRIGELWVTVTDATEYGITGPTAPEPSEQLVSKEFKVGNAVSGFTSEDVTSGKVTAERIYNNF